MRYIKFIDQHPFLRPMSNAKETSPATVTSGGNQFTQSQSSHNKFNQSQTGGTQFSQSQTGGTNFNQSQTGGTQFNQSSPRSLGTGANVIGLANNGSRTYNTTSGW